MTKKEFINELNNANISYKKIRFYKQSPYQKRRYKPEYVGWEGWLYRDNFPCGYLITQEMWETDKETALSTLK